MKFKVVFNRSCCHESSVYFSLAKFQLVSCNPSLAMIWQMTCTHKLPKLCLASSVQLIRFSLSICFDVSYYSQTTLIQTLRGSYKVPFIVRCPHILSKLNLEKMYVLKPCCRTKGFLNCVQIFD